MAFMLNRESPPTSPAALRCKYTKLGNLLKKNEVVDTYIEGDFKLSDLKELQVRAAECCLHGAGKCCGGDHSG
jgi:anaerobic ribonucleoside-triphosphate reductase